MVRESLINIFHNIFPKILVYTKNILFSVYTEKDIFENGERSSLKSVEGPSSASLVLRVQKQASKVCKSIIFHSQLIII